MTAVSPRRPPTAVNLLLLTSLLLLWPTTAYIPAVPSNDSTITSSAAGNSSTNWIIQLNWPPMGIFSDGLNLQLKADNTLQSIHQGALLHFSELNSTSQPAVSVPWIAMINCDYNSTNASTQDDVFTLARDRGARAVMIYSLHSKTCQVNQEFIDNFDKPLDVFSSGNLQGSRLIESQFSNVLGSGYWFQSDLLNTSSDSILKQIDSLGISHPTASSSNPTKRSNLPIIPDDAYQLTSVDAPSIYLCLRSLVQWARRSIPSDSVSLFRPIQLNVNSAASRNHQNASSTNPTSPVYLIATLASSDSVSSLGQQVPNNTNKLNQSGTSASPNTGLAMIILYAITGCVTLMFLIVIVSGAIRAIRHPERYGPRPAGRRYDPETGEEDLSLSAPQTRAAGLTKAILDTFPVVKFGRNNTPNMTTINAHNVEHPEQLPTEDRKIDGQEIIMMEESPGSMPPTAQHPSAPFLLRSLEGTEVGKTEEENGSMNEDSLRSIKAPLMDATHDRNDELISQDEDRSDRLASSSVVDNLPMNDESPCPICVCDFEEGDDIRVLPCDARHRFHKECVDPWLLNESRRCPLCRWDLSTKKDGSKMEEGTEEVIEEETIEVTNEQQQNERSSGIGSEEELRNERLGRRGEDEDREPKISKNRFVRYLKEVRSLRRHRNLPAASASSS